MAESINADYKEWMEMAEKGDCIAQWQVGEGYYYGNIGKQDYAEAFKWFMKAAGQGSSNAQANLGYMYYCGEGVKQDYAEAFKWLTATLKNKSCSDTLKIVAQEIIGCMYYYGQYVEEDFSEALEWFKKAVKTFEDNRTVICLNDLLEYALEAMYYIGCIHYYGQGTAKDYVKAFKWFMKTVKTFEEEKPNCDEYYENVLESVYQIGYMYHYGEGVKQDKAESLKWIGKAAENGYERAEEYMKQLSEYSSGR